MNTVTEKSDEIPHWVYGAVGGAVAAVAVVGTTFFAWRYQKRKKARDTAINEALREEALQGDLDSLRASTPRE